ncbi:hypothetical protein ACFY2H_41355 [Streptomyces griseofuscus]|uniref:hypothetical protein n=1 Tax=Streptomyces griseofuscus TaxID=146922 RepID=UPI0036CFF9DD
MHKSLRNGRRGLAATALALLLASGAVACGGENKANEQPAASHSSAEDKGDSASGSTGNDDGVTYTACMRKNGVDVPDPQPGKQVRLPDDVAPSLLKKAEKACGKAPGGAQSSSSGELANDPKLEQLTLKNQECMREHGYTAPDSKGGMKPSLPGQNPVFDRAQAACKRTGDALSDYVKKTMGEK